jgi:beta-lactamase class A
MFKKYGKRWLLFAGCVLVFLCIAAVYFFVLRNETAEQVQAFAASYPILTPTTEDITPIIYMPHEKEPPEDTTEEAQKDEANGYKHGHKAEALEYIPTETNCLPPHEPNFHLIKTDVLDAMLRPFGNDLAVYFENLESGFVYRHNADRVFFGASLSKASFALYIYMKAEKGEIDLDDTITYTNADVNWGSGIISRTYPVGTTFTIRELLRLNLSESDNVATLMLRRHFGTAGYRQFVEELGANPARVRGNIMDSNLTANDAGIFAQAIFTYIESGKRYSAEFKAALTDNQFPFIALDYPLASKTGWTRYSAWHEMAIVYAPSPFSLLILSARPGWTERDYRDFADIAEMFQQFNDFWFTPLPCFCLSPSVYHCKK